MEFCIIFRLFMSPLFYAVGEVRPGYILRRSAYFIKILGGKAYFV